jgi:alpha-beta hydrolase superfamily lysophospholipase
MAVAGAQLHPQRVLPRSTPASVGLRFQSVSFDADGLRLAGWWIPAKEDGQPVVVITHGLGANKEQVLYPALLLHQRGFNVLLFDFRAHGESDGFLISLGEREVADVEAAHAWVARTMPGVPIYGMGYSMGGSAVLRAAADSGIFDKVVLDSTYARVEDVANAKFLKFTGPLAGLLWQELRLWGGVLTFTDVAAHQPEDLVGKLAGKPLLLIHGTADRTISFHETERLKARAGAGAELWLVDGVDHIEAMTREEYGDRVGQFLRGSETSQ